HSEFHQTDDTVGISLARRTQNESDQFTGVSGVIKRSQSGTAAAKICEVTRGEKFSKVRESFWQCRGINVEFAPQVNSAIDCVVSIEYKVMSQVTFESEVCLITLRYSQSGVEQASKTGIHHRKFAHER